MAQTLKDITEYYVDEPMKSGAVFLRVMLLVSGRSARRDDYLRDDARKDAGNWGAKSYRGFKTVYVIVLFC